jgi:hypothetical protein
VSTQAVAKAGILSRLSTIVLVGVALRLAALLCMEGDIQDGLTRIMTARAWLHAGTPFFGRTVWPEGNYWLPMLSLVVWPDPYWAPRVLYALVSAAAIYAVYKLAEAVFDRRAAVCAGWLLALMPYHIAVSANSATSEGPYVPLVLGALLAAVRYAQTPRMLFAVAAGVCVAAASTFRIDGVVWGAPLALAMIVAQRQKRWPLGSSLRDLCAFGACGLAFLLALLLQWHRLYPHDEMRMLNDARLMNLQLFVNGHHPRWSDTVYSTYAIVFWPLSCFLICTPVVALLGYLGMFRRMSVGAAMPLWLGFLAIWTWLAYATFAHDILAQWRYALILACLLTVFVSGGTDAVLARISWARTGQVVAVGVVAAFATQFLITYAAMRGDGALGRQLGQLSPIKPSQFSSRDLLSWVEQSVPPNERILVTAHALEHAYLSMRGEQYERDGRLITQSYFLPHGILVHTHASLQAELVAKLRDAQFLATSTSQRELGLRDGLTREIVTPVCNGAQRDTCQWQGFQLTRLHRFGDIVVWRVGPAAG